jgi:uncharacterized membrane protein
MLHFNRSSHLNITPEEYKLIQHLRERSPAQNPPRLSFAWGDRLADLVAATVGSWRFIIIQSMLLVLWILLNVTAYVQHWDPYPFILLNLMLSFQAAYTAPIIMMSQNRQATIDRQEAKHDYEVNLKAELEIELLHDKINLLCEEKMVELLNRLDHQQQQLKQMETALLQQFTRSANHDTSNASDQNQTDQNN